MTNKKDTTTLSSYAYTYYTDGNQRTKTDHSGKVTTYTYDSLGRLTCESESGGGTAQTYTYTYDGNSNRSSLTAAGAAAYVTTYAYDANNRLLTETKTTSNRVDAKTYHYDPNGNQVGMTQELYSAGALSEALNLSLGVASGEISRYNEFNQLVQTCNEAGMVSYAYNAAGLRVGKTVGGVETVFVLDGGNVALELESGTVTAKYLWAMNLVCAVRGMNTRYYLYNGHGDVAQLTDASGAVTQSYAYDAFGVEAAPDDNDTNPFRYCGEYFDTETGKYYLRARYYDPTTGRFASEDPVGAGLNWYTYCENNPILFVDPWGLDAYIFYLPEWKNEARDDQRTLMEEYGLSEDGVILIPVNGPSDITSGWNAMGTNANGNIVTIDAVIINTHGSPARLSGTYSPENWWYFYPSDIRALDNKPVGLLILYGCNAGHLDYQTTNPAAAFAQKVYGAPVMASDGTVLSGWGNNLPLFGPNTFEARNDDTFITLRNSASTGSTRDNEGWMIYQLASDGTAHVSNITGCHSKSVFLSDMLNALQLTPSTYFILRQNNCSVGMRCWI